MWGHSCEIFFFTFALVISARFCSARSDGICYQSEKYFHVFYVRNTLFNSCPGKVVTCLLCEKRCDILRANKLLLGNIGKYILSNCCTGNVRMSLLCEKLSELERTNILCQVIHVRKRSSHCCPGSISLFCSRITVICYGQLQYF